MRRLGLENLKETQSILTWAADCTRELLSEGFQVQKHTTWKDFADKLILTQMYTQVPEVLERYNVDRSWLDPLTVWAVVAHEHPDSSIQSVYRLRGESIDAFQFVCIEFHLYKTVDPSIQSLFQTEIIGIAQSFNIESQLVMLPTMQSSSWSRQYSAFILDNCVGVWGKRNKKGNGIGPIVPNAVQWRKEWLTGWLFIQLINSEIKLGTTYVINVLRSRNSALVDAIITGLTKDMRRFRQLRSVNDNSKTLVALYLLRFGTEKMIRHAWKDIIYFLTVQCSSVDSSQHSQIILTQLMKGEPVLIPKFSHLKPIASVRHIANNAEKDIHRKVSERVEAKGKVTKSVHFERAQEVLDTIPASDSSTLSELLPDVDWRRVFEEKLKVQYRLAFILWQCHDCLPIDIPHHWYTEYASHIKNRNPKLTASRVETLCQVIMSVNEPGHAEEEYRELFVVGQIDSVRSKSDIANRKLNPTK